MGIINNILGRDATDRAKNDFTERELWIFDKVCRAAVEGKLALVSGVDKTTGKRQVLIGVVNEVDGEASSVGVIPFGKYFDVSAEPSNVDLSQSHGLVTGPKQNMKNGLIEELVKSHMFGNDRTKMN